MDRLGLAAVLAGRLGGWTQTSLTVEPSAAGQATRELRMLRGLCLICGLQGCSAANHKPEIERNAKRKASPQQDVVLPSTKRLHSQPSKSAQLCVSLPVAPRLYPRVKALGQDYTTLTWYLKKRPNDSQIARAIENCSSRALELSGGDSKTLMLREFVSKTEAAPPELLPSRRNLSATWAATACMSAKSGELLLARRASDITSCRQILWPCAALESSLRK